MINKMTKELANEKCRIMLKNGGDKPHISGYDLTDNYNGTTFFTQNVRGLNKGWDALVKGFNSEMSMYDTMKVLDEYKLKCHSYCSVD